ncbi:MAG: hypothetical protein HZA93_24145 [Verrucomicrobia bacterium]|nr:hypothetical protein [Verrucomicrobiota bacterium]
MDYSQDPRADVRLSVELCQEAVAAALGELPDVGPCTKARGLAFAARVKWLPTWDALRKETQRDAAAARLLADALKSALDRGFYERLKLPVEDPPKDRPLWWAGYVAERVLRDWPDEEE